MDQLIDKLNNCTKDKDAYEAVFLNNLPNRDRYERWLTFYPEHYARNCVVRTDSYELIMICWEKDQKTLIHDHDSKEGWVAVLEGELSDKRYVKPTEGETLIEIDNIDVSAGEVSYINDEIGLHQLANNHEGRTVSLHLYVPPIDSCGTYDLSGTKETIELEYHSLNPDGIPEN